MHGTTFKLALSNWETWLVFTSESVTWKLVSEHEVEVSARFSSVVTSCILGGCLRFRRQSALCPEIKSHVWRRGCVEHTLCNRYFRDCDGFLVLFLRPPLRIVCAVSSNKHTIALGRDAELAAGGCCCHQLMTPLWLEARPTNTLMSATRFSTRRAGMHGRPSNVSLTPHRLG